MDVVSIGGLVLGILSSIAIFIKGIRKCKCTRRGLTLERETKDDLQKQQEFTIKLIKLLQTYPPPENGQEYSNNVEEKEGQSSGGLSEISEEVAPEIKEQMIRMLEILNEDKYSKNNINKTKKKKIRKILTPMKNRDERMRAKIRKEVEIEMREKMETEINKSKKNPNKSKQKIQQNIQQKIQSRNKIENNTQHEIKPKVNVKKYENRNKRENNKETEVTKTPKITQFITTRN